MKDKILRAPLDGDNGYYVYTWNEPNLFQMQWTYGVEWPAGGKPTIWIYSYTCWQRPTMEAPWRRSRTFRSTSPCRTRFYSALRNMPHQQLYSRSAVVGSMLRVPRNFLARGEEAAGKRYDVKLLREMCQREAAKTASTDDGL